MPVKDALMHSSNERKLLFALGLAAVAHGIYRLYKYITEDDSFAMASWHINRASAHLFSSIQTPREREQRHVLVLGKGGSGKTRLLQCFRLNASPRDILPAPNPSMGFSVSTAGIAGINYNFWDVTEGPAGHIDWRDFLDKFDVLVWMVDSSRPCRFPSSMQALHSVLHNIDELENEKAWDRPGHNAYGIPVIIVAAKQDVSNSVSPDDVLQAMHVEEIRWRHYVFVVGTQVPNVGPRRGLGRLYELMSFATKKKYSCDPDVVDGLF